MAFPGAERASGPTGDPGVLTAPAPRRSREALQKGRAAGRRRPGAEAISGAGLDGVYADFRRPLRAALFAPCVALMWRAIGSGCANMRSQWGQRSVFGLPPTRRAPRRGPAVAAETGTT